MNSPTEIIVVAVLVVFLYAVLSRRLLQVTEPMRRRHAEMGERLLAAANLSDQQKEMVCISMERTFSTIDAWAVAVLMIPASILSLIDVVRGKKSAESEITPPDLRHMYRRFMRTSLILRLLNSPLALVIAALEMGLLLLTWIPFFTVIEKLTKTMNVVPPHDRHHKPA